ncbi:MAG: Hsp70 family protein, partial [Clostridia bacterium]|nr:Hsp70 family protein [Clostridia bacterium]
ADINAAVKDAEKYAEEDRKRKALIDAKNDAEQLILAMDKFITDNGDKLEEADKDAITQAIATAREEFESAETEEDLRGLMERMTETSDPIITKFYQQNPEVMAETMRNAGIDPDSINIGGADGDGVDGTID